MLRFAFKAASPFTESATFTDTSNDRDEVIFLHVAIQLKCMDQSTSHVPISISRLLRLNIITACHNVHKKKKERD